MFKKASLLLLVLLLMVATACQPIVAPPAEPTAAPAEADAAATGLALTGRIFEYTVGDYHIRVTFESEEVLHWEYVEAPGEDKGKNDTEEITRTDVRSDLVLLSWQEATGVYVIDLLDLANAKMYSNFVNPDHEFFNSQLDITFADSAAAEGDSETVSTTSSPTLTGRIFEYTVGDYHIRVTFESEEVLHWEYVEAPGEDKGKNDTEEITRVDVREDVVLLSWQEATGVHVIDVLDLGNMKLYSNFVTPAHEFSAGAVDVIEMTAGAVAATPEEVTPATLTGLGMEYSVGDYHIRVDFLAEAQLHWEYVEAPGEDKGKNDTEEITRTDVRSDLVLLSWQEATGVYVIDLLDLANAKMYSNFVNPDHEFFNSQLDITFAE
jgi:hypothetical protein